MAPDFTTLYKRWSTGTPRKEDMKFICTKRTYTKDLSVEMDTILSEVDSFLGFAPFIPDDIHKTLTVYLDDTEERIITVSIAHLKKVLALYEKELMSLEQEKGQNNWEEIEKLKSLIARIKKLLASATGSSVEITTSILGYYKRDGQDGKPEISLMMGALEGKPQLAAIVYVHELMHAYYDMHNIGHPHIPEIEEPLAEYGMLCFMEMFQRAHPKYKGLFDKALKHVENKKYSLGICHYGYGAFLFKDRSNFCVDWVNLFHQICIAVDKKNDDVKAYLKTISSVMYPHSERTCERLLYSILKSIRRVELESHYKNSDGDLWFKPFNQEDIDKNFKKDYPSGTKVRILFEGKSGKAPFEIETKLYASLWGDIPAVGRDIFEVQYCGKHEGKLFVFYEMKPSVGTTPAEWIAQEL